MLVVVALVSAVVALQVYKPLSFEDQTLEDNIMKSMNKLVNDNNILLGATRGPAINWTWDTWYSGPTCEDYSKYTLVDLSENSVNAIKQVMDAYLDQMV